MGKVYRAVENVVRTSMIMLVTKSTKEKNTSAKAFVTFIKDARNATKYMMLASHAKKIDIVIFVKPGN